MDNPNSHSFEFIGSSDRNQSCSSLSRAVSGPVESRVVTQCRWRTRAFRRDLFGTVRCASCSGLGGQCRDINSYNYQTVIVIVDRKSFVGSLARLEQLEFAPWGSSAQRSAQTTHVLLGCIASGRRVLY